MQSIGSKQAAEILGIDQASVSRLCRQKKLSATMISGTWIIDKESVLEYQKKNQDKAKRDPTRR